MFIWPLFKLITPLCHSGPKVAPKRPQSHPKATPKLPQSFPKASPKLPQNGPKGAKSLKRKDPKGPEKPKKRLNFEKPRRRRRLPPISVPRAAAGYARQLKIVMKGGTDEPMEGQACQLK